MSSGGKENVMYNIYEAFKGMKVFILSFTFHRDSSIRTS